MNNMQNSLRALALALSVVAAGAAQAGHKVFSLAWSGESFSNSAAAHGHIVFDDAMLPAVGDPAVLPMSGGMVLDVRVVVHGASAGNGIFGMPDFEYIQFWTPSALDMSKPLLGQTLSNGSRFGFPSGYGEGGEFDGGDFNFHGASEFAPHGITFFTLLTAGGEAMRLTSISPMAPVPEPQTTGLLALGFGVMGWLAWRRRAASSS